MELGASVVISFLASVVSFRGERSLKEGRPFLRGSWFSSGAFGGGEEWALLRWCRCGREISTESGITKEGSPSEWEVRGGLGGCPQGGGSSLTSSISAGSVFS